LEAGISSYAYTWAIGVPGNIPGEGMTVYRLLEKAAEFNVHVVQIADNLPLDRYPDHELRNIKNYAEALKIRIEVGARKMTEENLRRYIGTAAFFNSPILRFVIDGEDFEPDLSRVNSVIKKALPLLKAEKIILAIENHDRFKAREFAEIINKAGNEYVGICLDPVNSMGAGEGLETVMEMLAPYTVNLHVKEFRISRVFHKMGFVIEGAPLGEGMLPLKRIIGRVIPKCRSAVLEQWVPLKGTIEEAIVIENQWAKQSIHFLRSVL